LDDMPEIESDLSVFHRIDDVGDMPAWRFWRLVPALTAYQGALTAKRHVAPQEGGPPVNATPQVQAPPAAPSGARVIGATAAELGMSDIGDLFSNGVSGG
jgi:hypothetical protein